MVTDLALRMMAGPFVWGHADCCTSACDVFAKLHGIDPMAPLRGRYSTARGAYRLITRAGGWFPLFRDLAQTADLTLTHSWGVGRLALARVGTDFALVIGINDGLWAGKVDGGVQAVTDVVMICRN